MLSSLTSSSSSSVSERVSSSQKTNVEDMLTNCWIDAISNLFLQICMFLIFPFRYLDFNWCCSITRWSAIIPHCIKPSCQKSVGTWALVITKPRAFASMVEDTAKEKQISFAFLCNGLTERIELALKHILKWIVVVIDLPCKHVQEVLKMI